jgi:serine/threonine protein kinase
MLYYMLTGELPFKGDNQFVIREAKLFSEPKRPRDLNREIPRQLEDIILKAMDRDPEERYKTSTEMVEALRALPVSPEISKETVHGEVPETGRPPGKKSPLVRTVSIVAALIFIAAAIYVTFFTGKEEIPPDIPSLFTPTDEAVLSTARPEFNWSSTLEDNGSYVLQYDSDSLFSNPTVIPDLSGNAFNLGDTLSNGMYFWRVKAVSEDGLHSDYSNIFSFTVNVPPPETPQGSVEIAIKPGGDIYIDGSLFSRNKSRANVTLDTGRHIIRARNSSSIEKAIDRTIYLAAGSSEQLSFNFTFPEPEPDEPPETYGRLSVGSRPLNGAVVYINGERQERQTPNTYKIKSGKHIIRAVLTLNDRELTRTDTIFVAQDSTSKVIFSFEE